MRPPLSAASALRPHSSASIDRHKLPSLHSHNTSLPALYLPSQGQSQGSNETYSLRDVSHLCFFHLCIQWHCPAVTAYSNSILLFMRHCMAYLSLKLLLLLDWNVAKKQNINKKQQMVLCACTPVLRDLSVLTCFCSPLWSSHALLTPTLFLHHMSDLA